MLQPYNVYYRNAHEPQLSTTLVVHGQTNNNFERYLLFDLLAATEKSFILEKIEFWRTCHTCVESADMVRDEIDACCACVNDT